MASGWRAWLKCPAIAALGLSGLVCLAIIAIRALGGLQTLELQAYDQYLRMLRPKSIGDLKIVLVGVTEEDLDRYGWPLSDDLVARLLDQLLQHRPRAIGLDLFRDRPVPSPSGPSSRPYRDLDDILRKEDEIVGIMKFPSADGVRIPPPPAVADDSRRFGFADILVDPDGIVRRGLLYLDDSDREAAETRSSFALRLALVFLGPYGIGEIPDPVDPTNLRLGRTTYTPLESDSGGYVGMDARGYQYMLGYPLGADDLLGISVADALAGASTLHRITDRVVLVGTTAESVKDLFFSPLYDPVRNDQGTFGIVLHAQMTAQLILQALGDSRSLRTLSQSVEIGWIFLWCALGVLPALSSRSPMRLGAAAAGGVLILLGLTSGAFIHGWWLPTVPPVLGGLASMGLTVAYLSFQEQIQRRALMRLFSTYVSPGVAEQLWEQRDSFLDNGRPRPQQLTATVLFSDIRGFTTVSEVLPPEELLPWLNEYMEAMAGLILNYGGVIEKFAGDGITATFGVPVPRTTEAEVAEDARNAVRSALAMRHELERLNVMWKARGLPEIGIRVGINTGTLVVGSIGSARRMQYSIIGDTANTAARLESYAKDAVDPSSEMGRCRILVSESTRRQLDGGYRMEPIGSLVLKGKAIRISVYRVTGIEESP